MPALEPGTGDQKPKGLHIQVGKHLDLHIAVRLSPTAMVLLVTAAVGVGSGWGLVQQ
ncbi:hypothetical protein ACP4I1_37545 [Streptomyces sp. WG4]|uniref:hypothetical protein n=1 Tax=Streptomyces sp. WG4 TaxID=3417649 RepID=UPI003CFB4A70